MDRHAPKTRRGPFSSLTRRILAINLLALVILLGGIFYLDQFRASLIDARIEALTIQGRLIAGALGEAALRAGLLETGESGANDGGLDQVATRHILRRLAAATGTRARLYAPDGGLIADSRDLMAAGREVISQPLPPPEADREKGFLAALFDSVGAALRRGPDLPPYVENGGSENYGEVLVAVEGMNGIALRAGQDGLVVMNVAVPVQGLKRVLGALLLTSDSRDIDADVHRERMMMLLVFAGASAITAMLSAFLAGTIARPIHKLAEAAEKVRSGAARRVSIPDFSARRDEIGDLSASLHDMTASLYARLDAIEAFAADVAHELKNPLTSLRSAVETLDLAKTPEQRQRLLDILQEDVGRMDRLISDISDASRVDAELSRTEMTQLDMGGLLEAMVDVYKATRKEGAPEMVLEMTAARPLMVAGMEDRLGQVLRNLLDNAVSFSPKGGRIRILAEREGDTLLVHVEDDGPGLPESKLEAVFDRFYTERPVGEAFGTHSGLGLSISRQIVSAHGGRLSAANRRDGDGRVVGARFTMALPL